MSPRKANSQIGGFVDGKARTEKLTAEQRSAITKIAASKQARAG
jgi:hypothetical protein